MSSAALFGVYAPLSSSNLMLIIPLYLRPSVSIEREYGQFKYLGVIQSDPREIRSWGQAGSLARDIPMELLVTDEEVIQSIGSKIDSHASPQEVLLGIVSTH
ncbi:hypothetical protein [Solilutibacter silvestris]|uniref:Uncharacterized protein n=1 Tax=Solilutibacter silvestris TaxID=1645665 RepID=A0A2K1Q383_9GAMM|nr:hypothetical protein [Lysobacter silvestris]PNS09506.1 hypothetical protein Lysil_1135 [Lysobacter silvestris]